MSNESSPGQTAATEPFPDWYRFAEGFIGQREAPGDADNPEIVRWFDFVDIAKSLKRDKTAHCSAFANMVMQTCGYGGTRSAAARSWLKYGLKLDAPRPGCLVVYERPPNPAHGHIGFWTGRMSRDGGAFMTLGANQNNRVCVAPYSKLRAIGFRWATPRG